MAVEFIAALTLMRFYHSRSGDRWRHAVPLLRQLPIAFPVFDLLGIELVWEDGAFRVPIACPHCDALKLTRDDTYAVTFLGGGVHDHSGQLNQPHRIQCRACNRALDVTDLLKDWKAKDLDALLDGPLRQYAPVASTFVVDQPEDGKFWIGRTVFDALDGRVGAVFPLMRRLSRIKAMDADHAAKLVAQHHGSMTFRDVEINGALEPLNLRWHGAPLQEWERRKLQNRAQARVIQTRKDLASELEAFRRKRESELGL